jgi:membrane associated rhomboid family serine protease
MTSTPVGMRCPECASERTKVRTAASIGAGAVQPTATYILIAVNVVVLLAELLGASNELIVRGGLCANAIADGGVCGIERTGILSSGGELYRIVTSAFLHAGPLHLMLNMFALYVLGTLIEPAIGHLRFVAIYFAALLAGSFGALLLSGSNEVTVGASGAIFGLMGAAFVIARHRGVDQVASQIGLFVVLNLVFTFSVPGISIGGHIGGLIGGALAALVLIAAERREDNSTPIEIAGVALIVVASVAGALLTASGQI